MVTALGFAACVPVGAGANKPRSERPVAAGLVVALDGRGVETLGDGSTRIAGRGPDPFQIVATTDVVRHPYPGETVTAILTSGERVVKQAPFVFDAVHGRVRIEVPAPGTYRLELWSAERFLGGNTFVAASLPTLDGQRVLELHQDAGPQLILTRETAHLRWMHWDSVEADTGFVAEWWQDGKRIAPAGGKRSEFQREALAYVQATDQVEALAKQSVWRWTSEQFALPDDVITRAGHWELRIYREDRPALAFGFEVTPEGLVRGTQRRTIRTGSVELEVSAAPASRDAARQLAKLPRTRFEPPRPSLLPVTVAEIRALTRSEVLRGLRTQLNRMQRRIGADPSNTLQLLPRKLGTQPGPRDESPQAIEARKLVATMQRLIAALGEPWTASERP